MMRVVTTCLPLLCCLGAAGAAESQAPSFRKKPTATQAGDKIRIEFAVSRTTDVAVFIEDAEGRIVRHLVAGVLGVNPPPPLKANSLAQSIEWDGKDDDGRRVPAGKHRARVAAGLKAEYAGTAFETARGPDNITSVVGLSVGPGGRLYVLSNRWRRAWWTATSVHLFRRDGRYERTIKPFGTDLPPERVAALTRLKTEDARPMPTIYRVLAMLFYPYEDIPQQMAVTPEGNLHMVVSRAAYRKGPQKWLATIDSDGGVPYATYAGGMLPSDTSAGDVYLAAASDGKAVYATGIERGGSDKPRPNTPVVYKITLPDRKAATVFFGDPKNVGNDAAHLNDPRGLAVDGAGHVLVADRNNNRVLVISEKSGKLIGSIRVPSPTWVGVHRKTGAVYVRSGGSIVKFAGVKNAREVSRLTLPKLPERIAARNQWSFALDAAAEPPVLWIGRDRAEPYLLRCEDRGGEFTAPAPAACRPSRTFWNLSAGLTRREIGCKVGQTVHILDERTGKTRHLRLTGSGGQTYRFGPNGQIYGMDHWKYGIRRWDRTGKPKPYPATASHAELKGRLASRPSGTTSWERGFCVDRAGNVYVKHRGKHYHGRMRIDQYDPDGHFVRTVVWVVSDGAIGPRVDRLGNVYIAECIKPVGKPYPDFFRGLLPNVKIDKKGSVAKQYTWMYGSVVKFSPKGGAIWFPRRADNDAYGFDGEARLPDGLTKEKIETSQGDRAAIQAGELEGAAWWRFGCAYLLDMHPGHNRRCHCTACEFDIDDFGRVFYPDQGRFRVVALDTNGNEITAFGGYGNQDAWAAESYVRDPKGRFYRPRRPDDPKDLASPFATPSIAFGWFVGLTVSDRYAYVADALNRRVVRCRLVYAAEETCEIR